SIEGAVGDTLTDTGLILGTPAYMSPEQASGERGLDARTDVYALGCVLYEMLAGEPPFTGPTAQAIAAKRLTSPVPAVRLVRDTVPAGVEAVLMRALARVPADRFATAVEFAEALGRGLAEPASRRPAHQLLRSAALVAAVLLILAGIARLAARHVIAPADRSPGRIPLAVLPFRSLGAAADPCVLGIGIPDAIITRLAG